MKLELSDLFYSLGFDNVIGAEITRLIELGEPEGLPEIPELREWAERMAARFAVVKPGLLKRI